MVAETLISCQLRDGIPASEQSVRACIPVNSPWDTEVPVIDVRANRTLNHTSFSAISVQEEVQEQLAGRGE